MLVSKIYSFCAIILLICEGSSQTIHKRAFSMTMETVDVCVKRCIYLSFILPVPQCTKFLKKFQEIREKGSKLEDKVE